jgi:hypothetical protein
MKTAHARAVARMEAAVRDATAEGAAMLSPLPPPNASTNVVEEKTAAAPHHGLNQKAGEHFERSDMSSVVEFEISAGSGPPPGNYKAVFTGVEATVHESYGEGLRFSWSITEGPQKGAVASRGTGNKPSTGNAAGKMIAALTGQPLAGGQKVSVSACVGKPFLITVGPSPSGNGTRVETVIPL